MSKSCSLCNEPKMLDDFHRLTSATDGRQSRCKPCALSVAKQHYADNRDEKLSYQREWANANKEKTQRYKLRYNLRVKYGLSPDAYDRMLDEQNGRCAICDSDDPGHGCAFFCVDHSHETGIVRGLLCNPCNTGLGRFKDDARVLASAIQYLQRDF